MMVRTVMLSICSCNHVHGSTQTLTNHPTHIAANYIPEVLNCHPVLNAVLIVTAVSNWIGGRSCTAHLTARLDSSRGTKSRTMDGWNSPGLPVYMLLRDRCARWRDLSGWEWRRTAHNRERTIKLLWFVTGFVSFCRPASSLCWTHSLQPPQIEEQSRTKQRQLRVWNVAHEPQAHTTFLNTMELRSVDTKLGHRCIPSILNNEQYWWLLWPPALGQTSQGGASRSQPVESSNIGREKCSTQCQPTPFQAKPRH